MTTTILLLKLKAKKKKKKPIKCSNQTHFGLEPNPSNDRSPSPKVSLSLFLSLSLYLKIPNFGLIRFYFSLRIGTHLSPFSYQNKLNQVSLPWKSLGLYFSTLGFPLMWIEEFLRSFFFFFFVFDFGFCASTAFG